ncbi:MAG: adenylosuccinate synthetase [Acidobacteria bacterium]|nr:adenylosuccinate synthetase [Candidatus Sulfomarinibacter sp. MAG AM1]
MSTGSLMIIGGQWGDEGKGKVVDLLSAGFAAVVRYNGGNNAGHTVRFADRRFALHLVPSGIIHDNVRCYLASGMVVDPTGLVAEMDKLEEEGVAIDGRIVLSPRATLILPTHRALDGAREGTLGAGKIGTTGRGIGPAYQDRAQRRALRAHVLAEPVRLRERALALMKQHNRELRKLFDAPTVDLDQAMAEIEDAAVRLAPLLGEVGPALRSPSCGIGPRFLGPVVGVMKAYATRVGSGPFPSELEDATGERMRERGAEFGTTTGRPRRCGWFDAVAARYAVEVAGIDAVAVTKLDILDGFETIKVVTGYRLPDGSTIDTFPADAEVAEALEPLHEELPGWTAPTEGVVHEDNLPPEAISYLDFLEKKLGVPTVIVSTGPRREETLVRGSSELAQHLRSIIAG